MEEAKRFNTGKNRMDLVPPILIEEVGKILTFGADKYGAGNYKKGMDWSKCIASLKRHLHDFEKGIDYDDESKQFHISHVIVNAMFLLEYYTLAPQYDDRQHSYLNTKKISLDIDSVLSNFHDGFCKKTGMEYYSPTHWNDPKIAELFNTVKDDREFWTSLPVLSPPSDINFEVYSYITSRSIPEEWTKEWLDKNGYPDAPIHHVPYNSSKVEIAKENGTEIMVDDKIQNFIELNKAGILCYLFDQPHNQHINVGYKRIYNLKELTK